MDDRDILAQIARLSDADRVLLLRILKRMLETAESIDVANVGQE